MIRFVRATCAAILVVAVASLVACAPSKVAVSKSACQCSSCGCPNCETAGKPCSCAKCPGTCVVSDADKAAKPCDKKSCCAK